MKNSILWFDFETRSKVDINRGVYEYAQQADVLCVAWAIDDNPVVIEDLTKKEGFSDKFINYLLDESVLLGVFNANFERTILKFNKFVKHIHIPHFRWFDVATIAAEHGCGSSSFDMGGVSLASLGSLLGLPGDKQKLSYGKNLIKKFCIPTCGEFEEPNESNQTEWALFLEYCIRDVEATRECAKKLPTYNWDHQAEREVMVADIIVNETGIPINSEFARLADKIFIETKDKQDAIVTSVTNGEVTEASKKIALKNWINKNYDLDLDNMQGETLRQLDFDLMPKSLKAVIDTQLDTRSGAVKFAAALATAAGPDNIKRIYDSMVICGASRTRRWAGRGIQPHNFKRPELKQEQIDELRAKILSGNAPEDITCSNLGDLARSVIEAPDGSQLVCMDLSAIENRALMWLAGCKKVVQYYHDFDAGRNKFDPYVNTFANTFNVPPENVNKDERFIGKVMTLLLQYLGGVQGMINGMGNPSDVKKVVRLMDGKLDAFEIAAGKRERETIRSSVSEEIYIPFSALKRRWRQAHPEIVALGKGLSDSFRLAMNTDYPVIVPGSLLTVFRDGEFVFIKLPSGSVLGYYKPELDVKGGIQVTTLRGKAVVKESYYDGKFLENVASGLSRDILALGVVNAIKSGLHPIFTVHDEMVCCEPVEDKDALDVLKMAMTTVPAWAPNFPIRAVGFTSKYYRKE